MTTGYPEPLVPGVFLAGWRIRGAIGLFFPGYDLTLSLTPSSLRTRRAVAALTEPARTVATTTTTTTRPAKTWTQSPTSAVRSPSSAGWATASTGTRPTNRSDATGTVTSRTAMDTRVRTNRTPVPTGGGAIGVGTRSPHTAGDPRRVTSP